MFRAIKTFIRDPEPVSRFDAVEPGLNVVEGIVRVDEPIRSPVRGHGCAAFFYRSFFVITGGAAPAMHKIKEAEVYTSFRLKMEGGELEVEPSKRGSFEQRDHQALQKQYGSGFQGVEEVVLPGARVRIRGKAKRVDGKVVLKLKDIEVIDKQAVASGTVEDRKKRRKKKR